MKVQNHSGQLGFSMLELVIAVLLIGILAAVAVPRFQELTIAAQNAGLKATASELSVAASVAFTKFKVDGTPMPTLCSDYGRAPYIENVVSSVYTITGNVPNCELTGPTGASVTFFVPN